MRHSEDFFELERSCSDSFASACSTGFDEQCDDTFQKGLPTHAHECITHKDALTVLPRDSAWAQPALDAHASKSSLAEEIDESRVLRLHRACFNGDTSALQALLPLLTVDDWEATDKHGLAAVHILALCNRSECLRMLHETGVPVDVPSRSGWLPIEEALCYDSVDAARYLMACHRERVKQKLAQKGEQLQAVLLDMPDCAFQLKWEVSSPILGVLLQKYLPQDTYTVYKSRGRLRIDGHLKGLEEETQTLLPRWQYGFFSILVDTSNLEAGMVFVNHDKKTYMHIQESGSEELDGEEPQQEAMLLRDSNVKRSRVKFSKFSLAPVKSWLGSHLKEQFDGVQTTVYEAQGELMAATVVKTKLLLPKQCTYDEYIARPAVPDIEALVPLNFSSGFSSAAAEQDALKQVHHTSSSGDAAASLGPQGSAHLGTAALDDAASRRGASQGSAPPARHTTRAKGKGRKVKARLWMAHDFPLNQKQLLPLLDIMGTANKHIQKVAKFMRKYGDQGLFPVKVQVPLMLSVKVAVRVKNLCLWDKASLCAGGAKVHTHLPAEMQACPQDAFFAVPEGYLERDVKDWIAEKTAERKCDEPDRVGDRGCKQS